MIGRLSSSRSFKMFEEQALLAINNGRKKLSAKLIINYIRWNKFVKSNDKNFKINDAFQSYYARAFVTKYPNHVDKFNFRKLRNENNGPYMEVDVFGQLKFY